MSNSFNGLINLTDLWNFTKAHEDKVITLKNGKKAIRVNFNEKKNAPDQFGNTHYVEIDTYKVNLNEGENKYIGEFKPSKFNELYNGNSANATIPPAVPTASPAPVAPPPAGEPKENDLPF